MACNFKSLIWPAGSAPAALASLLFDSPEPQIIGKTQCFATFLPFRAPASSFFSPFLFLIFFLLLFSSLTLPISAFHLSILLEVWLLNFLRLFLGIKVFVTKHLGCLLLTIACTLRAVTTCCNPLFLQIGGSVTWIRYVHSFNLVKFPHQHAPRAIFRGCGAFRLRAFSVKVP